MISPKLIPKNTNELLILNSGVWKTPHYFRIIFSDPAILRLVLENKLVYDSSSSNPVQCYNLPYGQYYTVITVRYQYQGLSLSITKEGIGIRDCYNNHLHLNTDIQSITGKIDSSYQKDYSKPDLYPVYVDLRFSPSLHLSIS